MDHLALNGWIIINKPIGIGSTQVVGAVKRALRDGGYAKVKVGHGGTLDPLASGVLPIALGEATKLCGRMLDSDKMYDFTIAFGTQTDGLDAEGAVVATSDVRPTWDEVLAVLPRFTGTIAQVPPAYSAILIDGKRAYDRARSGEVVEMPSRTVEIFHLRLAESIHYGPLDSITLSAHVSKGTYIRSLARDIALAAGTVGHVIWLHRTKAGPFTLDSAISLDKLAEMAKERRLEEASLPLEAALDGIPALPLTPDQANMVRQGRVLSGQSVDDGLYLATHHQVPVALMQANAGQLVVVRGFNL